jgi:hypothetical protein
MKISKTIVLFTIILTLLAVPLLTFAEDNNVNDERVNCMDDDDFSRYILADPIEIMPNIDETTSIYFNYQCDHESNVELLDSTDSVVDTLLSRFFPIFVGWQNQWAKCRRWHIRCENRTE